MKLYKLTDENGRTRNGTQWGEGVTHAAKGSPRQNLCSDGWIHFYESPLIAVIMNPIHARFENPQLWEADGEIGKREGQLKCGCRAGTTIRRIELPVVTPNQLVRFAILCARTNGKRNGDIWERWADKWLDGTYRTAKVAAETAAEAWAAEAEAAEEAHNEIDFIALAERAIREENELSDGRKYIF